jgi:hypothetical protein
MAEVVRLEHTTLCSYNLSPFPLTQESPTFVFQLKHIKYVTRSKRERERASRLHMNLSWLMVSKDFSSPLVAEVKDSSRRRPFYDNLGFRLSCTFLVGNSITKETLEISVKSPCLHPVFHPLTPLLVVSAK